MLLTDDKFFNDPEFREMLKAYEEAASKGMPPFFDADDLIDIADYYRLTDQMDKAMEVAQNAIDLFPNATLPNVFMARNALQNDNLKEAEYYVSMIEAEDDPDYIYIKAELLIYQYKIEEAEKLLEAKFHELTNDDNGWFIKDVANLYLDYGEYERGYTWMMRYCDVKDDDYKELLGRALYGTWKLEECESIFTELADKYPFDKKYWKVLAEAQLSQNKFDEAINSSEYAIAIDPDDPVPHGIKASALMGKGNWEEAVKFFKTALSHAQYDCSGYIQLATCLINTNEFKEALEWLEKALKESGNAKEYAGAIYHQMALCQGALGNNVEAKKLLDKAEDKGENKTDLYVARAHILQTEKQYEAADRYFNKALELSTDQMHTLIRIAISLTDCQRYKECLQLLKEKLPVIDENCTEGLSLLALCSLRLNQAEDFLYYLRLAAERNPIELRMILGAYFPENMATKDYYDFAYKQIHKSKQQ